WPATRARRRARSVLHVAERYALVALVAAVAILFTVLPASAEVFPTAANLRILVANQAVTVLVALAVLLPLVAGHFDFSVGANAATASVICAGLMQNDHASLPVAVLAALGGGLFVGLVNLLAVTSLHVH